MAASGEIIGRVLRVAALKGVGLAMTLGLVTLQAAAFGAGAAADAFFFAWQTISGATSVFEGWLQRMLVPLFLADLGRSGAAARRRALRLAARIGIGGTLGATLLWTFAPQAVAVLAPGFEGEQARLAAEVLRVLAIGLPLSAIAALMAALEFSRRKFGLATVSTLMPRIVGLLGFALLGLAITVMQMAWFLVVGMALMAVGLAWVAIRALSRVEETGAPETAPPPQGNRAAAVAATYLGQLSLGWANSAVASLAAPGTVALMFVGLRLVNAAPGMANTAVSTVYFTEYADGSATGRSALAEQIASGMRLSLFLILPIVGLLLSGAEPLVRFLLQRGAFSPEDASALAVFVMLMAPSLFLNVVNSTCGAVLLADVSRPAFRPVALSVGAALVVRLGLGVILVQAFGLIGLAVTILTSSVVMLLPVWTEVRARAGTMFTRDDAAAIARMALATAIAASIPLLWQENALVMAAGYGLLYLTAAWAMGLPELKALRRRK